MMIEAYLGQKGGFAASAEVIVVNMAEALLVSAFLSFSLWAILDVAALFQGHKL